MTQGRANIFAMPFLRRCWSCNAVIGSRDRVCGRCGARQRDPKRIRAAAAEV